MMIGVWPFDEALDEYIDKEFILLYYMIYGLICFFIMITFFLVIVLDAFQQYKRFIEENVVEGNFIADIGVCIRHWIKRRKDYLISICWPKRYDMAESLKYIKSITPKSRHHYVTIDEVYKLLCSNNNNTNPLRVNNNIDYIDNNNTIYSTGQILLSRKYSNKGVHRMWQFYAKEFRGDYSEQQEEEEDEEKEEEATAGNKINKQEKCCNISKNVLSVSTTNTTTYPYNYIHGCLHPHFSVDAHRWAIKSRKITKDVDTTLRKKLNNLVHLLHSVAQYLSDEYNKLDHVDIHILSQEYNRIIKDAKKYNTRRDVVAKQTNTRVDLHPHDANPMNGLFHIPDDDDDEEEEEEVYCDNKYVEIFRELDAEEEMLIKISREIRLQSSRISVCLDNGRVENTTVPSIIINNPPSIKYQQ